MYAQRDDIGAVGAKLYFPDHTIQHAGVILGLGPHRTAGHAFSKVDGENLGYMGRLYYAQNVSAVTAACVMIPRRVWEAVSYTHLDVYKRQDVGGSHDGLSQWEV